MSKIEVHKRINQIISVFYFMRLWSDYQPKDSRRRVSIVFILSVLLYIVASLTGAAFTSETNAEQIYLAVLSITGVVMFCKLYYFIYGQNEILELAHEICVHLVEDRDEFHKINNSINVFAKMVSILNVLIGVAYCVYIALPIFTTEKMLPMKMSFPLNWRENELVYWITYIVVSYGSVITYVAVLVNTIIWYLMMSCVIKYKMLGNEFRNLGLVKEENTKLNENKVQDLFLARLIVLIKKHRNLQKVTGRLKSCFEHMFFLQIGTSGLNICCSLYNIGFNSANNLFMYICFPTILVYEFFDIFVITYYGNEIKFWSSHLSHSLFECNWMDQPRKCKKYIIILMEVLKRPQILVIGKLYPLDLEIFTNILHFAYGTFNILKNLQK